MTYLVLLLQPHQQWPVVDVGDGRQGVGGVHCPPPYIVHQGCVTQSTATALHPHRRLSARPPHTVHNKGEVKLLNLF